MIRLKDGVDKKRLINFGFKNSKYDNTMVKEDGVLSIYANLKTREIYGKGFYFVGDKIVLESIKGLVRKNLIEVK